MVMNLGYIQDIRMVTRHIYTIAYHRKKNTETPVKILILKQIYTETSEPSLEALTLGYTSSFLQLYTAMPQGRSALEHTSRVHGSWVHGLTHSCQDPSSGRNNSFHWNYSFHNYCSLLLQPQQPGDPNGNVKGYLIH